MVDNYFLPVMIAGAILLLLFLFFIVFYMLYHKRRIQQQYIEKEKLIYDHNFNLLTTRLEEQEGAMSQISREIHDNVAQKIDFLQMNSKALTEGGTEDHNARIINNISSLAEQIGNDLRNISYSLNGDYVTVHGLVAVLKKELDYISSSKNIHCQLMVDGTFPTFAPSSELLIYRIVQEALHNCVKHADATEINILINCNEGNFIITVADNGKGFDIDTSNYKAGLGFKNMQQRSNLLKATLTITSAPGEGCKIILEITEACMQYVLSGEILHLQ